MWQLPPSPTWDSLHPIAVHFPIVLLSLSPAFVVLSLFPWRFRWVMAGVAAVMMSVSTVGAWIAVSTGRAAGELAMRDPEVAPVLELHESLAETTASLATVGAIGFLLLITIVAVLRKTRWHRSLWMVGCLLILVIQALAALAVTNTGHNGGRLVHEFGIRALLPAEPEQEQQSSDRLGNAPAIRLVENKD